MKFILLLAVDDSLLKTCFGKEDEWEGCAFQSLSDSCSEAELSEALCDPNLQAVVLDDDVPHWLLLKDFFQTKRGFLVYFGIMGEYKSSVIQDLCPDWQFSGYTKHEFVVTEVAQHYIGDAITTQQYTKSNLYAAPVGDRLMTPKVLSFDEFLEDCCNYDPGDDGYETDVAKITARYPDHCENEGNQSPCLMRFENGGRFLYLGFVNGDENIPKIVRALMTDSKTTT